MSQMRENLKTGVDPEEAHVLSPAHSHQQNQHRNLQPRNHRVVDVDILEPEIPRGEPEIPLEHGNNSREADEEKGNEENEVYNENENPQDKRQSGHNIFEAFRHRAQTNHRKRKNSVKGGGDGNYIPPYKKNRFRRQTSVLPSKFLLGGNIHDPLNLASLADEKINAQLNKDTPISSPVPVDSLVNRNEVNSVNGVSERKKSWDLGTGLTVGANHKKHKNRKHRSRRKHGRKRTDSECSVASSCDNGPTENEEDSEGENENEASTSKEYGEENGEKFHLVAPALPVASVKLDEEENKVVHESVKTDAIIHEEKVHSNEESVVHVCPKESDLPPIPDTTEEIQSEKTVPVVNHEARSEEEMKPSVENEGESSYPEEESENPIAAEKAFTAEEGKVKDGVKARASSDYVPLSSYYAPSPFILDVLEPGDSFEVRPFESPSLTNYCCSNADINFMEPFSPPPTPEVPPFLKRMQLYANAHHSHGLSPRHMMSQQSNSLHRQLCRRRFRHHKSHKLDPIVSPVIPQHGNRRKHHHQKKNGGPGPGPSSSQTAVAGSSNSTNQGKSGSGCKDSNKKFRKKDQVFQFGNYQKYYGYRNSTDGDDPRLRVFKKEWFVGKDVLDVGCNIGHITLSIARDFGPRRVHGIDIDHYLVTIAQKNVKNYMIRDPKDKDVVFPNSLPLMYGVIQPPPKTREQATNIFPYNVSFNHENYVLEKDDLLQYVTPEYDVILLLSIAKWIHLNYGDDGLKRFFRRCYLHLRPGGKLILEPQPWSSYKRKKKLTEAIFANYQSIRFYPDHFQEFLIKNVGFVSVDTIGPPTHHAKGFQRPLLVFTKAMGSPTSK